MEPENITARTCFKEALLNEGFFSLWKGAAAPLFAAIPLNTQVFVVAEYTRLYL